MFSIKHVTRYGERVRFWEMDKVPNRFFAEKEETARWVNIRALSLISQPIKIILEIIRSRMKPRIEQHILEQQAGFGPSWGAIEQIFSLRLMTDKYNELQHE